MTIPSNTVFVQGLGNVSADVMNSAVQWVDTLGTLRTFVGIGQMAVFLEGNAAAGDGGQGVFVWNSTSPGPDNGATVIQPNGVTAGAWVRVSELASCLTYVVDGIGSVISTGVAGDLYIPFACTILNATLLADQVGSVVVDIWNDLFVNYPPTIADSIVAAAPPAIAAAQSSQNTALTAWRRAIPANSTLRFNISSVTGITRLTVALAVAKAAV